MKLVDAILEIKQGATPKAVLDLNYQLYMNPATDAYKRIGILEKHGYASGRVEDFVYYLNQKQLNSLFLDLKKLFDETNQSKLLEIKQLGKITPEMVISLQHELWNKSEKYRDEREVILGKYGFEYGKIDDFIKNMEKSQMINLYLILKYFEKK